MLININTIFEIYNLNKEISFDSFRELIKKEFLDTYVNFNYRYELKKYIYYNIHVENNIIKAIKINNKYSYFTLSFIFKVLTRFLHNNNCNNKKTHIDIFTDLYILNYINKDIFFVYEEMQLINIDDIKYPTEKIEYNNTNKISTDIYIKIESLNLNKNYSCFYGIHNDIHPSMRIYFQNKKYISYCFACKKNIK